AEFSGCLGLHIPHVKMAGSPTLPNENNAQIFGAFSNFSRQRLLFEQAGESQPAERQRSGLQEVAPRSAVACPVSAVVDIDNHEPLPFHELTTSTTEGTENTEKKELLPSPSSHFLPFFKIFSFLIFFGFHDSACNGIAGN